MPAFAPVERLPELDVDSGVATVLVFDGFGDVDVTEIDVAVVGKELVVTSNDLVVVLEVVLEA